MGIKNFRQLGGYKTIDNRLIVKDTLFRSGKLDEATDSEMKFLNSCNLKTVIDLRAPGEAEMRPEVSWPDINFVNLFPFTQEIAIKVKKQSNNRAELFLGFIKEGYLNDDMYSDIVYSDVSRDCFSQIFELLIKMPKEESILWHCSAGKDRTGLTSLLVMTALGVDRATCTYDFMLSDKILQDEISEILELVKMYTDDPKLLKGVRTLAGVNEFYIKRLYDIAEKEYGSVINLIKKRYGVTDFDIELLKKRYLM